MLTLSGNDWKKDCVCQNVHYNDTVAFLDTFSVSSFLLTVYTRLSISTKNISKKESVVLLLDVKAAYGNIHIPTLIQQLSSLQLPPQFLHCTSQLFSYKIYKLPHPTLLPFLLRLFPEGLPEGYILSLILFNLSSTPSSLCHTSSIFFYSMQIITHLCNRLLSFHNLISLHYISTKMFMQQLYPTFILGMPKISNS